MGGKRRGLRGAEVLVLALVAVVFGCERPAGLAEKGGREAGWSQEGLVVQRWGMFARDVVIYGSYAYVASGDLEVVDLANPAQPRQVATLMAGGQVGRVAVAYPYLYLGSGSDGIRVVYAGNPRLPRLVAKIEVPAFIHHLWTDRDWLYVAGGTSGVLSYDIRNRKAPVLMQRVEVPGEALHIAKNAEGFLVAAGSAGVKALIRHADGRLGLDPRTDTPGICALGVVPIGEHILVAHSSYYAYTGGFQFSELPLRDRPYYSSDAEYCRRRIKESQYLPTPLVGADFVISTYYGSIHALKRPLPSTSPVPPAGGGCRYLGAALVRRNLVAVACGAGGLLLVSMNENGMLETVGKVGGEGTYRRVVARGAVAAALAYYLIDGWEYLSPMCDPDARFVQFGVYSRYRNEKQLRFFREGKEPEEWWWTYWDIGWVGEYLGSFNDSEYSVHSPNGKIVRSHSLKRGLPDRIFGSVTLGKYLLVWNNQKIAAFSISPVAVSLYRTLELEKGAEVWLLSRGNDVAFFRVWSANRTVAFGPFGEGGKPDFMTIEDEKFPHPAGAARWGNYLLVASARTQFGFSPQSNRLYIYDLRGFPKKAPVATYSLEETPAKLQVMGDLILLAFPKRGLWVGRISRDLKIEPVGGISAAGCLNDFDVTDRYVFLSEGSNSLTRIPRPKWMKN